MLPELGLGTGDFGPFASDDLRQRESPCPSGELRGISSREWAAGETRRLQVEYANWRIQNGILYDAHDTSRMGFAAGTGYRVFGPGQGFDVAVGLLPVPGARPGQVGTRQPSFARPAQGGNCGAARAAATAENGFFHGTRYSQKVLEQMRRRRGEFHSFPESVTAFETAGTIRSITGGDGVIRQMLEIPGYYGGQHGVFQFIKEADGTINHRIFVPRP